MFYFDNLYIRRIFGPEILGSDLEHINIIIDQNVKEVRTFYLFLTKMILNWSNFVNWRQS